MNRSVQEGDESSDTGYCKDVKGSNERSLGNNEIKKIIEDYLPEDCKKRISVWRYVFII